MNEQLDKLESSVARLVQAYNELKQENENLKAQLADKTAAVDLLEEESRRERRVVELRVGDVALFERAEFEGRVGAADEEAAGTLTVRLLQRGLDRGDRFRIEQYRVAVVVEAVRIELLLEGDDPVRRAEHRDEDVDQVRAEVEDAAAPVGGEPLAERLTVPSPAHRGVDFEDLPEPPFAGGFDAELNRRIAAEHVGHLQNDVIFPAEVEQFVELLEVLAAGFIHVHVPARAHRRKRIPRQRGFLRFHDDGLYGRIAENLLFVN